MPKFSKKIYDSSTLKIDNLEILILRKAVKKIYLRVATNNGKILLIAPRKPSIQYLKNLVIDKLSWIKKHHEEFSKNNLNQISFNNGEIIEFLGNKFVLEINNNQPKTRIFSDYQQKIIIDISKEISNEDFKKLLTKFYRIELEKILIPLVYKWQKIMNLKSNFIGIKKMKTKWGSCNFTKARLWFSLELAKKPLEAIEYVVVHELSHLIEPSHNKKFVAVMNRFLPEWQNHKAKLR
jgi:hypothetical protein